MARETMNTKTAVVRTGNQFPVLTSAHDRPKGENSQDTSKAIGPGGPWVSWPGGPVLLAVNAQSRT
jgi:hypothetical protein